MYKRILVALDNSDVDKPILSHVEGLAQLTGAKVILMHVADGFVARHQELLNLADSEEMRVDREYLSAVASDLKNRGLEVSTVLELGEPAKQIIKLAHEHQCDLIAMGTHGHGWMGDFLLGSVASSVRHGTDIPVLLIRSAR